MLYALILTTYVFGYNATAVAQSTTPGFTSEQACRNAGRVAIAGTVNGDSAYNQTQITFQCAPLSL